jgi:hypothetical protein
MCLLLAMNRGARLRLIFLHILFLIYTLYVFTMMLAKFSKVFCTDGNRGL